MEVAQRNQTFGQRGARENKLCYRFAAATRIEWLRCRRRL